MLAKMQISFLGKHLYIDLDIYPPPTLVIEVANTSLADDQGEKRLLYEAMNVSEY